MSLSIEADPVPLRTDADGVVRIVGTRVTFDTVVIAFHHGATVEEIVQQYPTLALADVYAVIGHYLRHRGEVDAYLAARHERASIVQQDAERRSDPVGLRQRLMARRRA